MAGRRWRMPSADQRVTVVEAPRASRAPPHDPAGELNVKGFQVPGMKAGLDWGATIKGGRGVGGLGANTPAFRLWARSPPDGCARAAEAQAQAAAAIAPLTIAPSPASC